MLAACEDGCVSVCRRLQDKWLLVRVFDGGDLFTSRQLAGEGRALAADTDSYPGVFNVRCQRQGRELGASSCFVRRIPTTWSKIDSA